MTEQPFDSEVYLGRKRRERILSWGSMILGSLILLDSGAPIPFPLVGLPSILIGGALFGFGYTNMASIASYHCMRLSSWHVVKVES